MSNEIRELHIEPGDPIAAALMECSESGEFLCLVLPNQKRVFVHDEASLRQLKAILADPEMVALLSSADADHAAGRGVTLEHGENPRELAAGALGSPELADLLSEAADDFRAAHGAVIDSKSRPQNECVNG
jgi:hypothetical protein